MRNQSVELNSRIDNLEALVREVIKQGDVVMDMEKCCTYLSLKRSYIYKLTSRNQIPYFKPMGKRLYFSKNEIDAWLKRGGSNKTSSEIEEKAINYFV